MRFEPGSGEAEPVVSGAWLPIETESRSGEDRHTELGETRTGAEEARWFEENQDRLLKLFEQAGKEGVLR